MNNDNKCQRLDCIFNKHSNISNNGGTHCCYACKTNNSHGPYCQGIPVLNPLNVLMLIAHPDDDIIFGARDLILNNSTVVCFTRCGALRIQEFKESMRLTHSIGFTMTLPPGKMNWPHLSNQDLSDMVKKYIKDMKFNIIVSHGPDGEYGHIQHKRVYEVASHMAKELSIPFFTFRERFSEDIDRHIKNMKNKVYAVYKSQTEVINSLKNFFIK
jgi:LmbE family N-acetylglucosaminyl deacetylase